MNSVKLEKIIIINKKKMLKLTLLIADYPRIDFFDLFFLGNMLHTNHGLCLSTLKSSSSIWNLVFPGQNSDVREILRHFCLIV